MKTPLSYALVIVLLLGACTVEPSQAPQPARRVIILGFDGVEPRLVERMLAEGKLPSLQMLRETGGYQRLRSTIPPQSPAAWTSFATSLDPGDHGIFDYVARDLRSYAPIPGVCYTLPAEFLASGELRYRARGVNPRRGEPFWLAADRQGARSKVLHVPFAYPPDPLQHGFMLSGTGVPEIGSLTTHFHSFSTDFTAEQLAENLGGGVRLLLEFTEDKAAVALPGARVVSPDMTGGRVPVELVIMVDRPGRALTFEVQSTSITVAEGAWSPWVEWTLPVTDVHESRAISIFRVLEVGERIRFYMSSFQAHPREPFVDITSPREYAGHLADRYGLYKTLGWAHDTTALRRDALDEAAFLEEARAHDAWLEALALDELDHGQFDLLIAVWTSPDRISHVFWRYLDPEHPLYTAEGAAAFGDAVEESYARMDAIVGKVVQRLEPGDLLMVLSDHGFESFRTAFNVNTWLVRNGYMTLKGQTNPETAFADSKEDYLRSVDWSQTRAYALGMGAVYLNLQGREGQGLVAPAEADALLAELQGRLLEVVDPASGARVFEAVHTSEAFGGQRPRTAPDLQLAYAHGYQTGKVSAAGAVPREVFEPNLDKWSGEHASSHVEATPGILFSNQALPGDPAIVDLGVSALHHLGLTPPSAVHGRNLFATER